ncbi:MAG TPA: translational GTPase TypA [Candidatus Absconditabacterales bacterium]|nr:translational GTPase TypA [Candidatus Absconditabacterales bacterium]
MSPIRNIAIIAHVDHGKTSLVDQLLKQSGTLKSFPEGELVMDNNDQERERGITIYAKNTAIKYEGGTINIIDTPGHADFGSEVERVLRMIDCVLLVVDAYEGPMPQTKFVLKKSLQLGLKPIVVINKIDKPTARPDRVINRLFDLFIALGASDDQADFPIIYTSAKNGYAINKTTDTPNDMKPLFDLIIDRVAPAPDHSDKPFRMQIANLGYDNFVGRLGVGRVYEGSANVGQTVTVVGNNGISRTGKITKIYNTLGLQKIEIPTALCGDIVTIAGIPDIFVGETVGVGEVEPLPSITIDEPTLSMEFLVNDSPFAGKEGKYMTTRNLAERLDKELETNVGLNVENNNGVFIVSGRGELHLGVLIETMRREGREIQVGSPEVIMRKIDGELLEPIESVTISVSEGLAGQIIQSLSNRKGLMQSMSSENEQTTMEFEIPTRGLLGLRTEFILMTKGEGIMYSAFSHYDSYKGDIPKRLVGSMISGNTGQAMNYSIFKLQDRGPIFVDPAQAIYEGMIVGEHLKGGDIVVNLTVNKQLTNVRNSGNDEAMRLEPIVHMSLEEALGYIASDELVEITPKSIRMRKKYLTQSARDLAKKENKGK